ncbi:MAG: hypothetical protein ABFQ53_00165 [Patescibacteria group bacterium]
MGDENLANPMQAVLKGAKQFLEQVKDKSSEKAKTAQEVVLLLGGNEPTTIMMGAKRISQREKSPVVIELLINGHKFFFVENEDNLNDFFFTKDEKIINQILISA